MSVNKMEHTKTARATGYLGRCLLSFLAVVSMVLLSMHASAATHNLYGYGGLTGRDSSAIDSIYWYVGDGDLVGDEFTYTVDLRILNVLGETHHITTATFDINTGIGTQIFLSCIGSPLVCGPQEHLLNVVLDYDNSETLDISDLENITWKEIVVEDLGLAGVGDSYSEFFATTGPIPDAPEVPAGCFYNPNGGIDILLMMLLACSIFYGYILRLTPLTEQN